MSEAQFGAAGYWQAQSEPAGIQPAHVGTLCWIQPTPRTYTALKSRGVEKA